MSCLDVVKKIANDIKGTRDFFTSRQGIKGLAADTYDMLADKLARNIAVQINKLPQLKVDGAKLLNDAISLSGYSADGKQEIMDCIANKLIETPAGRVGSALQANQWTKLHNGMPFYISKSELDGLNDPKRPLANKIQIIVDRLCKLGIMKPDEYTFAWAVGIVVLCHFQDYPKYKHVFAILGDMKAAHFATRTSWPLDCICDYPMHPEKLPQDILDHAYDKDDPPQGIILDRLKQVVESHVPLSEISMLLHKEEEEEKTLREKTLCICRSKQ